MPELSTNIAGLNSADSNTGQNFIPLNYINEFADIYPYHDANKPLENAPIITGTTVFEHPNVSTFILVIYQTIYYGRKMKHSLSLLTESNLMVLISLTISFERMKYILRPMTHFIYL